MDAEKAGKIGRAFRLGMAWGKGVSMAQDEAKWITVHPNGTGANANGDPIKGRPLLIDDETGTILGGMGGKGKGKKLTDFKTSRKKMTFKSSGSASKSAKPHHNNPSLAGSGPFAAMARKFARENPEKFAEAQKQRGQPGKNPTIAAMRELNQLRHPAPSAGIPPASAVQPQVSAPAAASASSYKEAAERVKQRAEQESKKTPKENTSAKMYERAASRKKEKMNSLNEQLNGVKTRIDKLFQDQEAECRKDPEVSKWMDRREKKWNEIQEMTADLKQKFPNGRPDSSDRDGTTYWNNTQSFIESAWKDHDAANRHYNEAAAPIHEKYNKKYSDLIKERKGVESELEHQQKLLHQLHQRYTRRARQLGEEDFDE